MNPQWKARALAAEEAREDDATEPTPAERSVGEVVDRQWLLHNEDRVPEYPTGPACTHDSEGGY